MIHLPNSSALWGVVCLFLMGPVVAAQPLVDDLTALALPDEYGSKKWGLELSSITRHDGDYYAVSEKCKLLYRLGIKGDSVAVDTVIYHERNPVWVAAVAIEGIAPCSNHLIMVDEGIDLNTTAYAKLYTYHPESGKLSSILVKGRAEYLQSWAGNYGAKRVAVHEGERLVYILRKKNRSMEDNDPEWHWSSLITLKMVQSDVGIDLQSMDSTYQG